MKQDITFKAKVEELLKLRKPKIAFGLKESDEKIIESLKQCKNIADIILVGPESLKKVADFPIIVSRSPEKKLADLLVRGEVDGIIRGTVDDFKTYEAYQKLTNENYTILPGLVEDPMGRQFFISPASNPEGWEKEERLMLASEIGKFLNEWKLKPKIAIFSGERHETYPRKKDTRDGVTGVLNKTYEDAEWIVEQLTKQGYDAKHWSIDLNLAVEDGYNVLIPVNGLVGNQIFRVLLFCGGKIIASPRIGLSKPYEDNFRSEKDFEPHVRWLTAWINSRKS